MAYSKGHKINIGRKHSKEWNIKVGLGNKGKKMSVGARKKMSISKRGRRLSQETRKKLSEIRKKWFKKVGYTIEMKKNMSLGRIGMKFSDIHRKNMGKSKLGNKFAKGNKKSIEFYKTIGLSGLIKQQIMKEPTSIEKKLYDELKRRGLLFETQKLINGKFIVDAYIPKLNLIIEADGDYWHNLDRVIKKDKAENAYLQKCGFNLLRLSETEINNTNFGERIKG